MTTQYGMAWWRGLSSREKEAAVEPFLREGKANSEIQHTLKLDSPNMVASARHRLRQREPEYTPKTKRVPADYEAPAVPSSRITLPSIPTLSDSEPLVQPLPVVRDPHHKSEWQVREEESIERATRQIVGVLQGTIQFHPHRRPLARLEPATQRHIRRAAQEFLEWR